MGGPYGENAENVKAQADGVTKGYLHQSRKVIHRATSATRYYRKSVVADFYLDIGCPSWYNFGMRKTKLVMGEYYHIYNRGTDKRNIFTDEKDLHRFWENLFDFNQIEPIGSVYEFSFQKKSGEVNKKRKPLVQFIAYCINPNHFHFLMTPVQEKGIEKFMQRLGNGYTKYFNNRYKRSGVLFQGKFKSKHIDSNEYLLHLSAYINKNDKLGHPMSKLSKSSFDEFLEKPTIGERLCNTDIILGQFRNKKEYESFTDESFKDIVLRKEMQKELEN